MSMLINPLHKTTQSNHLLCRGTSEKHCHIPDFRIFFPNFVKFKKRQCQFWGV